MLTWYGVSTGSEIEVSTPYFRVPYTTRGESLGDSTRSRRSWTHFYFRILSSPSVSWEWWTEFRFLQRNRKKVTHFFCKTWKNCSSLREVRAQILHVHWSRFRKDLELWTVSRWHQNGKWDELAKQVADVYFVQTHPILKGCINFQKGKLKRGGENMHFSTSDPSFKIMMVDDFCVVFWICDNLGQINEIDFESRQNTAAVVLTPRVSETVTLSRRYAADNFSSCASTAEGEYLACRQREIDGRVKLLAISESTNNKRR